MTNIQSLSVVVPAQGCINNCKFCVSKMHKEEYPDWITQKNNLYFALYFQDYIKRLEYAQDNGVDTIILTGDTEPQQNWEFLKLFGIINNYILKKSFKHIEIQTTGTKINQEYLYFLRNHVGVTTISLSTSSIFDDEKNRELNGTAQKHMVELESFCHMVKKFNFSLRLSINLSDYYHDYDVSDIFNRAKELGADQITFRRLYAQGNSKQAEWIRLHDYEKIQEVEDYIRAHGVALEKLDYGFIKYSVDSISTVLDDDCMSKNDKEKVKYLILRPDCKLYTQWDDKGSLIF